MLNKDANIPSDISVTDDADIPSDISACFRGCEAVERMKRDEFESRKIRLLREMIDSNGYSPKVHSFLYDNDHDREIWEFAACVLKWIQNSGHIDFRGSHHAEKYDGENEVAYRAVTEMFMGCIDR